MLSGTGCTQALRGSFIGRSHAPCYFSRATAAGRGRTRGLFVAAGLGLPGAGSFGETGASGGPNSWLVPSSLFGRITPADAVSARVAPRCASKSARTACTGVIRRLCSSGGCLHSCPRQKIPHTMPMPCMNDVVARPPDPTAHLTPPPIPSHAQPASSPAAPLTVYTIRLITSFERGSALTDPMAGVNVCLIAKDGRALLHRVPPVNDPQAALSSMDDICAVRSLGGRGERRA